MATVQIKVDTGPINEFLKRMPDQIPYATAEALNSTAFDVRRYIVKSVWPRSVEVKSKPFARAMFRVKKAHKRGPLFSAVFADPSVSAAGAEAIKRVEEGIRHYPYSSRYLAVPTRNALTRGGRLSAKGRRVLDRTEPNTFVADRTGRGPAIWLRTRRGLQMMFILKSSVPTPRVFGFGREAEKRARRAWPKNIVRAVKKTADSEAARARRRRGRLVTSALRIR